MQLTHHWVLFLQGCHGGRPVTLIGCSMGARLIFHTLLELSRLGAHGCVENVILLGAPLSCR
jgi:surfactin synthase thioesterase subunit